MSPWPEDESALTTDNKRERKSYTLQLAVKQIRSMDSCIVAEQARPVLALGGPPPPKDSQIGTVLCLIGAID